MGCSSLKEEIEQLKNENYIISNKNKKNEERIRNLENNYNTLKKENEKKEK